MFSGTFIANHYHQAVQIIEELEHDLERCKDDHNDFKHFVSAEREYLSNLEKPDPGVEQKKLYVGSLRQLVKVKYVYFTCYWRRAYPT